MLGVDFLTGRIGVWRAKERLQKKNCTRRIDQELPARDTLTW